MGSSFSPFRISGYLHSFRFSPSHLAGNHLYPKKVFKVDKESMFYKKGHKEIEGVKKLQFSVIFVNKRNSIYEIRCCTLYILNFVEKISS